MDKRDSLRGFRAVCFGVLSLLVASCASVSVKNVAHQSGIPMRKPSHIYVEPFAVANAQVKENFARKTHGHLPIEARDLLSEALASELTKAIAPASVAPQGRGASPDIWVVSGEITRIAEGSRFLRMGFGLGMGGTKLDTRVQVRSGAGNVFIRFATTGGSGALPGAATNPAPFSSLPTALIHTKEGLTDDAQRTARMIAGMIAQEMVQRGWIAANRVPKPKMQGGTRTVAANL
jgi:hypothetical protein